MSAAHQLAGSQKADPQTVKQWAAEDFAISIGLLRECPYHGQPFKAARKSVPSSAFAAGLVDPLDPVVKVFNGNTRELLAAVESVTGHYGDCCEHCASEQQDLD